MQYSFLLENKENDFYNSKFKIIFTFQDDENKVQ